MSVMSDRYLLMHKMGEKRYMKIKKRYIFACVLLCILSIGVCVAVYYIETAFAGHLKQNRSLDDMRSAVLTVTAVTDKADDIPEGKRSMYIGRVLYVTGGSADDAGIKIDKDSPLALCGSYEYKDNEETVSEKLPSAEEMNGKKIVVYYDISDHDRIYVRVPTTLELYALIGLAVIAAGIIVAGLVINKMLAENTFNDSPVTIMDIPIIVIILGGALSFLIAMYLGNLYSGTAPQNDLPSAVKESSRAVVVSVYEEK